MGGPARAPTVPGGWLDGLGKGVTSHRTVHATYGSGYSE
jgi:hypothetical protein